MTTLGIPEGSLREASLSRAVACGAAQLAPDGLSYVALSNPRTLPLFNQDVLDDGMPFSAEAMTDAVAGSDALLIVTPEYKAFLRNHLADFQKYFAGWETRNSLPSTRCRQIRLWNMI